MEEQTDLNRAIPLPLEGQPTKGLMKKVRQVEQKYNVFVHMENLVLYFFGFKEDAKAAQRQVEMALHEIAVEMEEIPIQGEQHKKALWERSVEIRNNIY